MNGRTPRRLVVPLGGHAIVGSGADTAAASVLLRDLIAGPLRPAKVLATGPAATYTEAGGQVLAIVAAGGVRLPCAVMLAAGGRPLTARSGSRLAVGRGGVYEDGRQLVVVRRWFDPRVRLAGVGGRAVASLAAVVRSRGSVDAMLPHNAVDRLAAGLASEDAVGAVSPLLGRGTGLTPAGDDLVAGALASLRALGSPAADQLGMAVRALARTATTRLSAALLEAADVGALVPEAAGVLRALAGGGDVETAADRLVALGHTSGWHLAAGLLVGVTHAGAGPGVRVPAFDGDGFRRFGTPLRHPGEPLPESAFDGDGFRRFGTPVRRSGDAGVPS